MLWAFTGAPAASKIKGNEFATSFHCFLLPKAIRLKCSSRLQLNFGYNPSHRRHRHHRTRLTSFCKSNEQVTYEKPFSQGFSSLQEDGSPWDSENLWSTLAFYVFTMHIPLSFGGLSVVALFTREPVLDPQTEALSLLTIQVLELYGALLLLKYRAKPDYKFTDFFIHNKLLNDRNWVLTSALGFGFLVLLIFLTSLLADRIFGSKPVNNPIVKEILLSSDISRVSCVLLYCIVTPLLEEFVYRGFLLTSLSSTMEWQQAVAISSVIFGAVHFSGRALSILLTRPAEQDSPRKLPNNRTVLGRRKAS